MKLNIRALSIAAGIIWAAAVFITGIANMAWKGYGTAFLEMTASLYPGYDAAGNLGDLIVGTIYGLFDGALCGLVFGWLYNRLSVKRTGSRAEQEPIEP